MCDNRKLKLNGCFKTLTKFAKMSLFTSAFLFLLLLPNIACACPQKCKCGNLKVDCAKMALQIMPSFGTDLNRVLYADLGTNEINRLSANDFKNLRKVKTLILEFNQIDTIESGTFANLTFLKTLSLKGNSLNTLSGDAFSGLTDLHSLDISQNYLRNLDGTFRGMTNLYRLDISHNSLTSLSDLIFDDLQGLMYLLMGNNIIRLINKNTFSPLAKLSYLVLKNNPLYNVDNKFVNNRRMSYIDLTNTKLQRIPEGLPWVLRYLQLTNNNITTITKQALANYNYVGVIVLDQNEIQTIAPATFSHMKYLRELWLNANKLTAIPEGLPDGLKFLFLDANKIETIHKDMFASRSNLLTLSMKGNQLLSIARHQFDRVRNITKLYLDNNNISTLEDNAFEYLGKLKRLFISRNPLTRLTKDTFSGLNQLRYLQLAFITTNVTIDERIFQNTPNLNRLELQYSSSLAQSICLSKLTLETLGNLTLLNIMSAELSTLIQDFKIYLPKLQQLRLADNKFHCDKSLIWLKNWMVTNMRIFADLMDVKCFSPKLLEGRLLSTMQDNQFVDETTTTEPSTVYTTPKADSTTTMTTEDFRTVTMVDSTTTTLKRETEPNQVTGTSGVDDQLTTQRAPPTSPAVVTSITSHPVPTTQGDDYSTTIRGDKNGNHFYSTMINVPVTTRVRETTSPIIMRTYRFTHPTSETTLNAIDTWETTWDSKSKTSEDPTTKIATTTSSNITQYPNLNSSVNSNGKLGSERSLDSSDNVNITAIAISISVFLLLVIVGIVGYLVFRYRKNQLFYNRAVHYEQHRDMYYITLSEPENKRPSLSRSERGSASSHTSEDITNEDSGVKFFHWDNS